MAVLFSLPSRTESYGYIYISSAGLFVDTAAAEEGRGGGGGGAGRSKGVFYPLTQTPSLEIIANIR